MSGRPVWAGNGISCWGLKGTIRKAELHLIKQRMWSGRIARAPRRAGDPLPAGMRAGRSGRANATSAGGGGGPLVTNRAAALRDDRRGGVT